MPIGTGRGGQPAAGRTPYNPLPPVPPGIREGYTAGPFQKGTQRSNYDVSPVLIRFEIEHPTLPEAVRAGEGTPKE